MGIVEEVTMLQNMIEIVMSHENGIPVAVIQDQKSSGTDGGTFTSGAWRTRTLNTTVLNTIGAGFSLSSNQFTLAAAPIRN